MQRFTNLTKRGLLALAISSEEEDGRIYADFAHELQGNHPDSSRMFADMAADENEHRRRLIDVFAERFGSHIPPVRRADVKGCVQRKLGWQVPDAVVVVELLAIALMQWKYMDPPPLSVMAKIMLGGALVLATGILVGSA